VVPIPGNTGGNGYALCKLSYMQAVVFVLCKYAGKVKVAEESKMEAPDLWVQVPHYPTSIKSVTFFIGYMEKATYIRVKTSSFIGQYD
jgi:hypothetical protein